MIKGAVSYFNNLDFNDRASTLKLFNIITGGVFGLMWITDSIIDIANTPAFVLPLLFLIQIFQLVLIKLKVPTPFVAAFNFLQLLGIIQFVLINNPQYFHVIVYWTALIPILVIATVRRFQATIWFLVTVLFIITNGLYISKIYPSYTLTLYPVRFTIAGSLFILVTVVVAIMFYRIQAMRKRILIEKNEEINTMNEELKALNDHLEEKVGERTEYLKQQNAQLSRYAFLNSHVVRAPLASILGLINLLHNNATDEENEKIIKLLKESGHNLDTVITEMNNTLDVDVDKYKSISGKNPY